MAAFVFALMVLSVAVCHAAELPNARLAELDHLVKAELVLLVVKELNTTITRVQDMNLKCETEMKLTSESCSRCPGTKPHVNLIKKVEEILMVPVIESGKCLKRITSTIGTELGKSVVGRKIQQIGSLLGSTIANFGKIAINAINNVVFKPVAKITKSLISKFKNIKIGFKAIGNSIINLANNIKKGISKGWNSITGGIMSILGRRKRSPCSDCEKLNSEDTNVIIENVCGTHFLPRSERFEKRIEAMETLYEAVLKETVITKVVFDENTVKMDYQTFAFTAVVTEAHYRVGSTKGVLTFPANTRISMSSMEKTSLMVAPLVFNDYVPSTSVKNVVFVVA